MRLIIKAEAIKVLLKSTLPRIQDVREGTNETFFVWVFLSVVIFPSLQIFENTLRKHNKYCEVCGSYFLSKANGDSARIKMKLELFHIPHAFMHLTVDSK